MEAVADKFLFVHMVRTLGTVVTRENDRGFQQLKIEYVCARTHARYCQPRALSFFIMLVTLLHGTSWG